ncbi:MAG TPA: NAD-binding protein, partial [Actinomycetota bacterium]|nr:NAD-binding protein [Actinomycetota bacterium]
GVLFICAVLFWFFERGANPEVRTIRAGFLWVTRTLLQQEPPYEPETGVGVALYYVVVVTGVGIVALLTATIATKFLEVVMRKDAGLGDTLFGDHVLLCGWNTGGERIVRELHSEDQDDPAPIVIIAPLERNPMAQDELTDFVRGSPTDSSALRRAGIERARSAIVLADSSNPTATPDDIDAKTLLSALAVESENPDVYTCVEVLRGENRAHFERARVNEVVVSAEITGGLLASSAVTRGLGRVISDLTSHVDGHELYSYTVPTELDGQPFASVLRGLKESKEVIPIAVATGDGFEINPSSDRPVRTGERLLVIAESGRDLA